MEGIKVAHNFKLDPRFQGIEPLEERALLSSATPHKEDEWKYIEECYKTGWLTTLGTNIDVIEQTVGEYMSTVTSFDGEIQKREKKAVALVNGTAAIHLAVKLCAEKVYHSSSGISTPSGKSAGGALFGKKVFVSDMTFDASVNPIVYEGGEPVFIDSEPNTWNMDPEALKKAFELYPDVKIVIFVQLYGVPGKIEEVKKICEAHNAVLIEDAAESLGATIELSDGIVVNSGSVGDYGIISYNGNKILTGSSGGMLIVPDEYSYLKAKKWSTQSREAAPWYEHEELGYNYRISNVIAGIVRGQWGFLSQHIEQKKAVYERYVDGFTDLPVTIYGGGNYWLSSLLINTDAMCATARSGRVAVYESCSGKSCPTEVLEALNAFNAEGRPIWKPMHLQPIYRLSDFVTVDGINRGNSGVYIGDKYNKSREVTTDIFNRGLCLPSDNKMDAFQQERIIDLIHRCFV